MRRLLIGFDSAWTAKNKGAIVAALIDDNGQVLGIEPPRPASYAKAWELIAQWQTEHCPSSTLVLLDQPTIVKNAKGQRTVEKIVCPAVSLRRGGMQPANRGRTEMFGPKAPIWSFLRRCGGPADALGSLKKTSVLETYPVLAMIAMDWVVSDEERPTGRLPCYNPTRRTFKASDWRHVCRQAAAGLAADGLHPLADWLRKQATKERPSKADQDCLDACLCLMVALHLHNGNAGLYVGNQRNGYIVTPYSEPLRRELVQRCKKLQLPSREWIRVFWLE